MNTKHTLALSTAFALCGLFGAATSAFAADTLVVAGYGSSTEQMMRQKVFPAFEKANDVKIEYVAGNSTDTLAKLIAQKGAQQIDVAMIDDGPMQQAVSLGLCAPIEGLAMDEFEPVALFPGNKAIGFGINGTGLMYNKKVFEENGWPAPTSWNDLKDPKYKGKVVFPPMSNGYGLLATVMLARMGGGGETDMEPGFAAMLNEVGPNVLAYEPSPAKMTELFQTGGAVLSVWGDARFKSFKDTGFPVEFVYPKEGAPVVMAAICPVAKEQVSAKAQAFVAWIMSAEIQKLMAEEEGMATVRKGIKLDVEPIGDGEPNLVAADWLLINEHRAEWNKRWVREIEQ